MVKKKSKAEQPAPRVRYAMITISVLGNAIYGDVLIDPSSPGSSGQQEITSLDVGLLDLAEGGYVIDLRPLEKHPQVSRWITDEPYFNGDLGPAKLEDDTMTTSITHTRVPVRPIYDENKLFHGGASGYDFVSASYHAEYWRTRGARVGKREGMVIKWSDGIEAPISIPVPLTPADEPCNGH
jgi:hypothetical protein